MTTALTVNDGPVGIDAQPRHPYTTVAVGKEPSPGKHVLVAVRWPVGGIRTHVLYNYPTLLQQGYRFTFVGPDDGTLRTFADSLSYIAPPETVGVAVKGKRCGLWREVRRQLRTGRFDVLHSHGVTAAVHSAVGNLALNYPHVATLHDVFRPCHFAGLSGVVKRRVLAFLLKQIHTLVPVSDDVRQNLLEYLPSLANRACSITTILNGIQIADETLRGPAPVGDLREQLSLYGNVRVIGFLGRFMEQKGFLPFIHALRELADGGTGVPFHVVAVGSGDYRHEYAAEVRRLGLADHVTMLDFVADIRPLLAQLDLLVIPSLWEASSLLAMEAMIAGVPVLGTDCIGLREVLRGTPARTVAVGDVHALATGLRLALESPWKEEARSFAGTASTRFDNAPSARKLAAVLDGLTATRRSRT